jgi:hypothetical protein
LSPRVIFSPAARRRNRRAFPGLARALHQVKTPAISVDEFSEALINAQVQPTRKDRPGKLGIPAEAAVDYARIMRYSEATVENRRSDHLSHASAQKCRIGMPASS